MSVPTHYTTLGLSPAATQEQIRANYKLMLRSTHPDRGGDPALFIAVQDAYAVLSDPAKRASYDQALTAPPPQTAPDPADDCEVPDLAESMDPDNPFGATPAAQTAPHDVTFEDVMLEDVTLQGTTSPGGPQRLTSAFDGAGFLSLLMAAGAALELGLLVAMTLQAAVMAVITRVPFGQTMPIGGFFSALWFFVAALVPCAALGGLYLPALCSDSKTIRRAAVLAMVGSLFAAAAYGNQAGSVGDIFAISMGVLLAALAAAPILGATWGVRRLVAATRRGAR